MDRRAYLEKIPKKKIQYSFEATYRTNMIGKYEFKTAKAACFSQIFNYGVINVGSFVEIDLLKDKKLYHVVGDQIIYRNFTPTFMMIRYFRQLNKLYSGVHLTWYKRNKIWYVNIEFSKKYPLIVAKDMITRVRFAYEYPFSLYFNEYMLDCGRKFSFKHLDVYLCKRHYENIPVYPPTGHFHFSQTNVNDNPKSFSYKNYEENVLATKMYTLHELTSKLLEKHYESI